MPARDQTARAVAPILALTGFRFGKDYRHGQTRRHRAVYALISTPAANIQADTLTAAHRQKTTAEHAEALLAAIAICAMLALAATVACFVAREIIRHAAAS